jgi:hypothetical protein
MTRKRYTAPTGPGTLGLLSSTAPLIKNSRGSGKDMCAQAELDSVKRNRDFPRESSAMRVMRLRTEGMAAEPNPKVPDRDEVAF